MPTHEQLVAFVRTWALANLGKTPTKECYVRMDYARFDEIVEAAMAEFEVSSFLDMMRPLRKAMHDSTVYMFKAAQL